MKLWWIIYENHYAKYEYVSFKGTFYIFWGGTIKLFLFYKRFERDDFY